MVTTSEIEYESLGRTLVGRLALPDGDGPHPGVLISHEGPGLDDLQLQRADELAELGYVAFALDYHGGGKAIVDRDEALQRLDHLFASPEETRTLGQAGLDVLLAEPTVDPARIAGIGYCFGGAMVLELGRAGANLKAIVGFHPGLRTQRPKDAENITGSCSSSWDPKTPRSPKPNNTTSKKRCAVAEWTGRCTSTAARTTASLIPGSTTSGSKTSATTSEQPNTPGRPCWTSSMPPSANHERTVIERCSVENEPAVDGR